MINASYRRRRAEGIDLNVAAPVVPCSSDGGMVLAAQVVNPRNQQWLWTVWLARLHGSEETLEGGRFALYRAEPQENLITLERHGFSGAELMHQYGRWLDWIADRAEAPWSATVQMHSMKEGSFAFTFECAMLAVSFALMWK